MPDLAGKRHIKKVQGLGLRVRGKKLKTSSGSLRMSEKRVTYFELRHFTKTDL